MQIAQCTPHIAHCILYTPDCTTVPVQPLLCQQGEVPALPPPGLLPAILPGQAGQAGGHAGQVALQLGAALQRGIFRLNVGYILFFFPCIFPLGRFSFIGKRGFHHVLLDKEYRKTRFF